MERDTKQTIALQVRNLIKKFDGFTAVDNISFEVQVGRIFAFLCPNEAGKTTTTFLILSLGGYLFSKIQI